MTTKTETTAAPAGSRTESFKQEVSVLKIKDPNAGNDQKFMIAGLALMVIGIAVSIIGYTISHGTTSSLTQNDAVDHRHHRRGRDGGGRSDLPALLDGSVPALLARPLHLRGA